MAVIHPALLEIHDYLLNQISKGCEAIEQPEEAVSALTQLIEFEERWLHGDGDCPSQSNCKMFFRLMDAYHRRALKKFEAAQIESGFDDLEEVLGLASLGHQSLKLFDGDEMPLDCRTRFAEGAGQC